MLDEHWANNRYVLGKWNEIKAEGATLTAVPEFDMKDADAASIAGKVDRGYIKGCSMGILFDPKDMEYEADGTMILNKCELLEASIVAIPSNANAIRLYHCTDKGNELMTQDEIKICLTAVEPSRKLKTDDTMKKVFLSTAALIALALTDKYDAATGIDQSLVDEAIGKLKAENDRLKTDLSAKETALNTITQKLAADRRLSIEKKVDDGIAAGKFDAVSTVNGKQVDNRTEFINMGLNNEATLDAVLSSLPAKKSLAADVHNTGATGGDVKTMDDFQKLNDQEQLAFKVNNPETYNKLVASI